jgi:hypothetical protein
LNDTNDHGKQNNKNGEKRLQRVTGRTGLIVEFYYLSREEKRWCLTTDMHTVIKRSQKFQSTNISKLD